MKKLTQLHEEFLDAARRPMSFDRLPVLPKGVDVPVIATNAWIKKNNSLSKKFEFMSKDMRNKFVLELFEHEEDVGHHAKIHVSEDDVTVFLQTKDIEQITELDKEYAKYADLVYKDVVYQKPEKKFIKPNVIYSADSVKLNPT